MFPDPNYVSSVNLTIGLTTLTFSALGHPEVATTVTIINIGNKWRILQSSINYDANKYQHSGGAGAGGYL